MKASTMQITAAVRLFLFSSSHARTQGMVPDGPLATVDSPGGQGVPQQNGCCAKENKMLVLTRRCGEEIVIGGNIHVTVLSVQGDKVRLGITAPRSVSVDRQEVHERRAAAVGEIDPKNDKFTCDWNPATSWKAK
jgi:carbon storage regulator